MPKGRPTIEQLLALVDVETDLVKERFGGLPHRLELDLLCAKFGSRNEPHLGDQGSFSH